MAIKQNCTSNTVLIFIGRAIIMQKRSFFSVAGFMKSYMYYLDRLRITTGITKQTTPARFLKTLHLLDLTLAAYKRKKNYLGGKFAVNFNNLNNELFPTRG